MKSGYQGVGSERMHSDRGVCWGQQGWGREGTTARHSPAAFTTPVFLLLGLSLAPSPFPPSTSVFHMLVRLEALSKLGAGRGTCQKSTRNAFRDQMSKVFPRDQERYTDDHCPHVYSPRLGRSCQHKRQEKRPEGQERKERNRSMVCTELERNDKPPASTERLQVT